MLLACPVPLSSPISTWPADVSPGCLEGAATPSEMPDGPRIRSLELMPAADCVCGPPPPPPPPPRDPALAVSVLQLRISSRAWMTLLTDCLLQHAILRSSSVSRKIRLYPCGWAAAAAAVRRRAPNHGCVGVSFLFTPANPSSAVVSLVG